MTASLEYYTLYILKMTRYWKWQILIFSEMYVQIVMSLYLSIIMGGYKTTYIEKIQLPVEKYHISNSSFNALLSYNHCNSFCFIF